MLTKSIKFLLLATALTPLVFAPAVIFPFILGKAFFFRVIIEIALVLFLIRGQFSNIARKPLFILVALFFISAIISTVLAVNPYRAFWGEAERMEGLFGLLHYFVFFVMAISIFEKKDWINFIKISLGVGFIIAFYAFLQFFGIENFPFAFPARGRPTAFLGNSSYLGAHFLFILGFSFLIFFNSLKRSFWRYFSLLMAVLSVSVIFLSGTRGAIVALFVGLLFLLFYFRKLILEKKAFLLSVLLIVFLFGGFWLTRNQPLWQSVPGVDRIASFSLSNATVQTRLISIGASWSAFKEKPLLGWGPENFNIAYNKYYNPDFALSEAAWFDRAHNKILDVAVMQGILGLLFYLGIFGFIFYRLIRFTNYKVSVPLLFILITYFVQNLFVFDQINSYLMFFAVLGITFSVISPPEPSPLRITGKKMIVPVSVVAALIIYIIYAYNYIPYKQTRAYKQMQDLRDVQLIDAKTDEFLYPYNFSQSLIRPAFLDFMNKADAFDKKEFSFVADKALIAMKEYIEKEPYYPRQFIRLSEAYNERGKIDPEFYKKAELLLERAFELSPKRQEVRYHLAYTLVAQDKLEEAIKMARETVELSPEVGKAHYILGVILSLAGDENRLEGEREIEKAFELGGLFFLDRDYENLNIIFSANLVYHIQRREAEEVIRIAERFKEIEPDLTKQFNAIIELAKEGRWSELSRLIR